MQQSERTWFILIVIGFIEILIFVGYQLYVSITGQNVDLVKRVNDEPIPASLGLQSLEKLKQLQTNVLVQDEEL